ncbi:MAG: hypothetical protein SGPRY_003502 [Prymnesium sp.]
MLALLLAPLTSPSSPLGPPLSEPPPVSHTRFATCFACVAAGFGWDTSLRSCGAYANKRCGHGREYLSAHQPPRNGLWKPRAPRETAEPLPPTEEPPITPSDPLPSLVLPPLPSLSSDPLSSPPPWRSRPPKLRAIQMAGCNTDCGRVEVLLEGREEWHYMCSSNWTLAEAGVVCRSLGFSKAVGAIAAFGGGGEGVAFSDVRCRGNETTLEQCDLISPADGSSCGAAHAVGVSCQANTAETDALYAASAAQGNATAEAWAVRREEHAAILARELAVVADPPTEDCEIDARVPLPFSSGMAEEALVFASELAEQYASMDRSLRKELCSHTRGRWMQNAIGNLTSRGMRANAVGIDLSRVVPTPTQLERSLASQPHAFSHA